MCRLRPTARRHKLSSTGFGEGHQLSGTTDVGSKHTGCFARVCTAGRCSRQRVANRGTTCAAYRAPYALSAGRFSMRRFLLSTCLSAAAVLAGGPTQANDELIKMSQNPKDWVMPTGDYANQRYSKLNQITAQNVGRLQVAWTFSTGVLRGHEGGPLVIGDVMYVHGPFPNPVFGLDQDNDAKILS